MSKPRTPIGTYGTISCSRLGDGRVQARTRFRDWDGALRRVQATADTNAAAEHALKMD